MNRHADYLNDIILWGCSLKCQACAIHIKVNGNTLRHAISDTPSKSIQVRHFEVPQKKCCHDFIAKWGGIQYWHKTFKVYFCALTIHMPKHIASKVFQSLVYHNLIQKYKSWSWRVYIRCGCFLIVSNSPSIQWISQILRAIWLLLGLKLTFHYSSL